MWTSYLPYLKVVGVVSAAFFVLACSETKTEKVPVQPEVNTSKGIVYQPSELAKTMRKMYVNMKLVNEYLDSNQMIPDSLLLGYESMLTDVPTKPKEIGATFYGFAEGWLLELETFSQDRTIGNYNSLMNACVHCHQSFCPGPIKKIKRLKLIGM